MFYLKSSYTESKKHLATIDHLLKTTEETSEKLLSITKQVLSVPTTPPKYFLVDLVTLISRSNKLLRDLSKKALSKETAVHWQRVELGEKARKQFLKDAEENRGQAFTPEEKKIAEEASWDMIDDILDVYDRCGPLQTLSKSSEPNSNEIALQRIAIMMHLLNHRTLETTIHKELGNNHKVPEKTIALDQYLQNLALQQPITLLKEQFSIKKLIKGLEIDSEEKPDEEPRKGLRP